jgi:hypothetical protein
LKKY